MNDEKMKSSQPDADIDDATLLGAVYFNGVMIFDSEGNAIDGVEYFDEEGDLKPELYLTMDENYTKFPVDSDIVLIQHAELFAGETHGNYGAKTLYRRAK
ncbi:hypothetical protein LEM8419_03528 [Neolewinella maritima]|uniref:Uncharacterized protein n=1 Tax=Neolewinella maritima TaxID=1383882 RepID=A0ABM9B5H8_9BACT|nr:hypothetical protein [Neolewinella maritima]CAH1002656.1 hypothetical protein LEM8419_03528 [Neolewinella maritima]